MRSLHVPCVTVGIGLLLGVATSAGAQTAQAAPSSPLAPAMSAPPMAPVELVVGTFRLLPARRHDPGPSVDRTCAALRLRLVRAGSVAARRR